MKRSTMLLMSMSFLLTVGVGLLGAGTSQAAEITATVVSMDDQGITVRKADGVEEHYSLMAGFQVSPDIQPGSEVTLTVEEDAAGILRVSAISEETPSEASAMTSSESQEAETQSASETRMTSSADTEELPATSSSTWLYLLLGLAGLSGAILLRRRNPLKARR